MSAGLPTPAERLTLSRERMRLALRELSAPSGDAAGARASGAGSTWLDGLKSIPGAAIVIDAVRSWWGQHPLRVVTLLANAAAKAAVQPVAQRHPLGLVLGALVLGGVLGWARPWRRIATLSLFAGLLPRLLSKAVVQIPTRSWMAVVTALLQPSPPPTEPAPATGLAAERLDASTP